jgi:hypothetical protein
MTITVMNHVGCKTLHCNSLNEFDGLFTLKNVSERMMLTIDRQQP